MKRGLFLLILISLMYQSFSQNLVVNPGLETWGSTVKPTDWINTQNCLKDSTFVKSGNYACRQDGLTSSRDLGQRISVSPGKQYKFSFFFKTGITTSGNGCRLWCEWLDETKTSINDPSSVSILHSVYMKSDAWQQFSCDITSPSGAGYFYLIVRTLSNSTTYWDDFVFEESIPTNNSEEQVSEIKIYPNPAHDYLNISNLHGLKYIVIQSLTGSSVWSSSFSGEENLMIPLSEIQEGIYIITIKTAKSTVMRKFIKK